MALVESGGKSFLLDNFTAPRSPYLQLVKDSVGNSLLTLLNTYTNSIYFYDYGSGAYLRKIDFHKEGPDGVLGIAGYYIKSEDSIFLYSMPLVELVLAGSDAKVKRRLSLKGTEKDWALRFPQYVFSTVCPIMEAGRHLILTGCCPFSLEASQLGQFKFSASIDLADYTVEFHNTYPESIYGHNANWEDQLFMQVYPAVSPAGDIIHSFPASHDVYVTRWNADDAGTPVYAGSNVAGTITSIDWDFKASPTPRELIYTHYLQQDLYAGILYDRWRKVYYRFLPKGVKDATTRTPLTAKPVTVICMDEQFNYLGETALGTSDEWNWSNSFVTKEGLNIEYIDKADLEETYMNFRIFVPLKITNNSKNKKP